MKTAALLAVGATPGLAISYFLLLAYLLNRVRPLPITFLPDTAHHASGAEITHAEAA